MLHNSRIVLFIFLCLTVCLSNASTNNVAIKPHSGAAQFLIVKEGESLWRIARRHSDSDSLNQMMFLIYHNNVNAFMDNNPNKLKIKARLVIPKLSHNTLSNKDAIKTFIVSMVNNKSVKPIVSEKSYKAVTKKKIESSVVVSKLLKTKEQNQGHNLFYELYMYLKADQKLEVVELKNSYKESYRIRIGSKSKPTANYSKCADMLSSSTLETRDINRAIDTCSEESLAKIALSKDKEGNYIIHNIANNVDLLVKFIKATSHKDRVTILQAQNLYGESILTYYNSDQVSFNKILAALEKPSKTRLASTANSSSH